MSGSPLNSSADNPLNVRLTLSKSFTRKLGDNYQKIIAAVETDKPQGVDVPNALRQLAESLDAFLSPLAETGPDRPENTQSPGPTPGPSELATTPQDPLVDVLERLAWRPFRAGHRSSWAFTNELPAVLIELLAKGPAELGQFQYRFSGPVETPRKFVSRSPVVDN